jgi:hypothetical protein
MLAALDAGTLKSPNRNHDLTYWEDQVLAAERDLLGTDGKERAGRSTRQEETHSTVRGTPKHQ